eukprot:TRINITY_DN4164_c2_g2_i1.p2 TRINITY_DN4164_c2_g2~~TRINITY_DN4164_c2_g2_i1.p2  ORF type:complete len:240 (-),score=-22.20 TRINITY_DN4164_c2_g2_i1:799-1518(-)
MHVVFCVLMCVYAYFHEMFMLGRFSQSNRNQTSHVNSVQTLCCTYGFPGIVKCNSDLSHIFQTHYVGNVVAWLQLNKILLRIKVKSLNLPVQNYYLNQGLVYKKQEYEAFNKQAISVLQRKLLEYNYSVYRPTQCEKSKQIHIHIVDAVARSVYKQVYAATYINVCMYQYQCQYIDLYLQTTAWKQICVHTYIFIYKYDIHLIYKQMQYFLTCFCYMLHSIYYCDNIIYYNYLPIIIVL